MKSKGTIHVQYNHFALGMNHIALILLILIITDGVSELTSMIIL